MSVCVASMGVVRGGEGIGERRGVRGGGGGV